MPEPLEELETDVLVTGGGGAGFWAALKACEHDNGWRYTRAITIPSVAFRLTSFVKKPWADSMPPAMSRPMFTEPPGWRRGIAGTANVQVGNIAAKGH